MNRVPSFSMRRLAGAAAVSLLCGGAVLASDYAGAPLAMFSVLESGEWQFREHGAPNRPQRSICLGNPSRFIQIAHGAANCDAFVVRNDARHLTISYQCGPRGQGMTSIRMETSKLIQLETQGIRDGSPFAVEMEGRRIGRC